jgi:hypothetical protein
MARDKPSFLRRILRAITGAEGRRRTAPKPPEPPPFERQYPAFPPEGYRNLNEPDEQNHITYTYITGENPRTDNFEDWWELFIDTGITRIEQAPAEVDRLWDQFLRAFYLTGDDEGSVPRNDFYADSGLTKRRIDWQKWREVKRTD